MDEKESMAVDHSGLGGGCSLCRDGVPLELDFTMAFQPIVDCRTESIFGYESLVRGLQGESAQSVISRVHRGNRYAFDRACRVKAISLAAKLGLQSVLSINFLPNAIYDPALCIRTTLVAARANNFPIAKILFEFTEAEQVVDSEQLKNIVNYYQAQGFKTAIDDFGSGFSGLNLLADFQTSVVKFDMDLIRNIHEDPIRQTIVTHSFRMLEELNITPLAEGVETREEMHWLWDLGIGLMQGYFFAKPVFEYLPGVDWSQC